MTRKEAHTPNSTFAIGGVSFSADSLVVAESSVLRIKFSGKKPAHRKSANRYRQGWKTRTDNKTVDNFGTILRHTNN
jgi:hypothetical protein